MPNKYPIPDIDPDEFIRTKYKFGDFCSYNLDDFNINTPSICYEYIDLDKTEYNFHQSVFDSFDIKKYFSALKDISSQEFCKLRDSHYSFHFHIYYSPSGKLLKLVRKISGKSHLTVEETPPIGQFALYTDPKGADRKKKIKSPRIYFIVGPYAILYILFYDPYHEINPLPK